MKSKKKINSEKYKNNKLTIDYSKCQKCKENIRDCRCYEGISDYNDNQNYCGGY